MHNRLLLIGSILMSVLILEQGLQSLGPVSYKSESRTYIDGIGQWRSPNSFVPRPRYSNEFHDGYYTNSRGMVDDEIAERRFKDPDGQSRKRIAFLGDSIIEGLAVPPGSRMTELIERDSKGLIDALNFSSSGTGTVQQIAIYESLARPYAPDIVVLSIFPANDIANNYEPLDSLLGNNFLHHWISADLIDDTLVLLPPTPPPANDRLSTIGALRALLPATYAHLSNLKWQLKHSASTFIPEQAALAEGNRGYMSVYSQPDPGSIWDKAWSITEHAILDLKRKVEEDGSQFILVILPDPIHSYSDQLLHFNHDSSTGVSYPLPVENSPNSMFYPHERLARFAANNSISAVHLFRSFRLFQDETKLAPPYFGFATDGHWSSVGHRVAADSLLPKLLSTIRADVSTTFAGGAVHHIH